MKINEGHKHCIQFVNNLSTVVDKKITAKNGTKNTVFTLLYVEIRHQAVKFFLSALKAKKMTLPKNENVTKNVNFYRIIGRKCSICSFLPLRQRQPPR